MRSRGEFQQVLLPFCSYLAEVERHCLSLLSPHCYDHHQLRQVWTAWLRQEVGPSLRLLPRDQFFQCNSTTTTLGRQELSGIKEMISQRDWLANSRFCPFLLTYSVQPSPNYWLHSFLRCDGLCDPDNKLETPFRVSPTINNPPREYRKRVRVIDYRDSDYLNTAMKETQESYERCLTGLGFPHNLTGEEGRDTTAPTPPSEVATEVARLASRSCGLFGRYLHLCQPLLTRCLTAPSQELVRSRDAGWLVSRLTQEVRRLQGGAQFSLTDCEVLGGEVVSSATLRALWSPQSLLSITALLLSFLV